MHNPAKMPINTEQYTNWSRSFRWGTVTTIVKTSAASTWPFVASPTTNFPLWDDWDSVEISEGSMAWSKFCVIFETANRVTI